jgi:hypothetical protein
MIARLVFAELPVGHMLMPKYQNSNLDVLHDLLLIVYKSHVAVAIRKP